MKRRHKIILGLVVCGILCNFAISSIKEASKEDSVSHAVIVPKNNSVANDMKDIITYKDLAISTLERSEEQLGKNEVLLVKEALTKAYDYISEVEMGVDVEMTVDNGLSLTGIGMVQSMVFLHELGYRFDGSTVEVYPSEAKNVYQFVYQVKSEGVEPINYAGNYTLNGKQLEIVHQMGAIEKIHDVHNEHEHLH